MTNQLEEFIKEKSIRSQYFWDTDELILVEDLREFFKDKVIIDKAVTEGESESLLMCAKCGCFTDKWRTCGIHNIVCHCECQKCEEDKQKALKGN